MRRQDDRRATPDPASAATRLPRATHGNTPPGLLSSAGEGATTVSAPEAPMSEHPDPLGTAPEDEGRLVAAAPAPAALPPARIGRYRVERLLGQGGFGLVYLAHDEQLQRLVAIKVPHRPARGSPPRTPQAYLAEARTVANLDHPNIVPVYDVGSTDEFPCFVVSKYIDGTDLATRLKQSRLSLHEAVGTGGDGGRGAALRPQARAGASGHQAGQHPARQERQAVRGRFRAGLAGTGRGQGAALRRHARLHESRTGPRRRASGRWPQRHFQPGRGASTNC